LLQEEGLIDFGWVKQSRGRPVKTFRLAETAEGCFPKHYDQLLEELIVELSETDGPNKFRSLVDGMACRWAREFRPLIGRLDFPGQVRELARRLDLGGMMTHLKAGDDGLYYLEVSNCVYRRTSLNHREMCGLIPRLISELTGARVTVDRSIHSGCGSCSYLIEKPE
jgi:predicted ArsR family transcriptional regulator